jgi:hypothetical protein
MATIEAYQNIIKTKLADKTVRTYVSFLKKLESDTGKTMAELLETQNEIDDYIEGLDIKEKTKNDKHFIIKSFITNLELDYVYQKDLSKYKSQQKTVDVTLDDVKAKYNEIKDTIQNKNHKL